MSDDDSTESQPEAAAVNPVPVAAPPATEKHSGVHIPNWLAGVLVVVLAFVIGTVGFALGRSTADGGGGRFDRPALVHNTQHDDGPGRGMGGRGGNQFPGGPGGPQNGGPQNGGPQNGGPQNGGPQNGGPQNGGPQNGPSQGGA